MAHSGFVPLRVFSSYTMLEGAIEPKAIAKRARELGFPAVAVTDRNGLYCAMAFSDECKKAGVQPVIGTMLGVARPHRPEGAPLVIDWLALYAQDATGYDNLCALVSMAHLDRPIELDAHVPFEALEGRTGGLIALTAGAEGALARLYAESQPDAALAYVAAQMIGAVLGVWVAHAMFAEPLLQVSTKLRDGAAQGFSEVVATFGLIGTILGTRRSRPDAIPAAVGAYIVAAYWFTASTSFANPAVTIARCLSDTFAGIAPVSAPLFIAAQLAGTLAAIVLFGWLLREEPA